MAEEDNKSRIRQYKTAAELIDLWNSHKAGTMFDEDKDFWKNGKLLEYVILRAFELEGATVRWPYSISMDDSVVEQIDGAVHIDDIHVLVECKDYNKNVNIEPFSKMRNQLLRRPASVIGCIFVREGFTEPATTLARFAAPQTILLWSGAEFEYCIAHSKMIEALKLKIRIAAEEFDYSYNVKSYFVNKELIAKLWNTFLS